MDYSKASAWYLGLSSLGSKPGLEAISALLKHIDSPERRFRSIHVTGTNGKGSTSAYIAGILGAAGYSVGLFTSPHLSTWRESIVVDGEKIMQADASALMTRMRSECEAIAAKPGLRHPTQFETLAAAAFQYFADRRVDFAVVEVGMGGRLDATNVIRPEVAVITNVSLEHTAWLGDTILKITREKSGIIKPGCSVITATTNDEVYDLLRERSREEGATITRVGIDVTYSAVNSGVDGQTFHVKGALTTHQLATRLLGEHQATNGATAVAVAEALIKRGFKISQSAIVEGIRDTNWPGRLEIVQRDPLVLLDGAKDAEAARALSRSLKNIPRRRLITVIAISGDKDIPAMVGEIAGAADHVIATKHRVIIRAADPHLIAAEATKMGKTAEVQPDVASAVRRALEIAGSSDAVLVAGSVFLVGEAREIWYPPEP
ncbi:TPA: bifunctional folylpolyglutamate synthase/dihydrofolate synthase [Candidatus Bathyarchaeota archaeon]|nr:bifunctional folylpolyglutamate synthase/dihydrofolate synthase [Candidatus Bathyarchaeota archaeon]